MGLLLDFSLQQYEVVCARFSVLFPINLLKDLGFCTIEEDQILLMKDNSRYFFFDFGHFRRNRITMDNNLFIGYQL